MAGLQDFRTQHPEYNDMPDLDLAQALHDKFYSDIPLPQYLGNLGLPTPYSREYADWAASRARSGKSVPQISDTPPATPAQPTGLNAATAAIPATMQGITGSIPFLNQTADALIAGGQTLGDIVTQGKGDFGQHYGDIQARRQQISDAAPVASVMGGLGGTVGLTAGLGALPGGAEAMGLSGGFGKQLANSILSTAGYEGLQGLAKGHTGGQLLGDEGIGAVSGGAGSLIGQGVSSLGESLAKGLTRKAQNAITDSAIEGSQMTSRDLKDAGSQLFSQAFPDGNIPMVTSDAYGKFMGDVEGSLKKFRPNSANDPQAVGLLQHLRDLQEAAGTQGTAIDLQDLHLTRQLASKVAQSPSGRDSAIGTIVLKKIDEMIDGLKPTDILGGADPAENVAALQGAIGTWAKAKKVDLLEEAVRKAEGYKSGYENGLRLTFGNLMKGDDFARFSPAEQEAIRQVAKGTPGQNIASLVGTLGISTGGQFGAKNIIGAGVGTSALAAGLYPFMGPAALPTAAIATTGAGALGRRLATDAAETGAERAIQATAIGGIPAAAVRRNLLAPAAAPIGIGARALGAALVR